MCSLHLSLKKLLFATDRGRYREPQPIKLQNQVPRDTIIYNTLLYLKLRQSCGRWLGGCRSQRVRDSVVWLCLLLTSEATPIKPYQQDCPNLSELNREDNNKHAKLQGENPTILSSTQRTTGPLQGKVHPLVIQCLSALKTHIQTTLYVLNRLYLGVYTYIHIHIHIQ